MLWATRQPATHPIPSGGLTGEGAESARYEYNGLHWRTRRLLPKEYGTSPSYIGTEEWRYFYSAAWQLLEERVDEDADSTFEVDQLAQQFWGLRYIDDAVARRVTSDWEEGWDRGYYHITNVQFSTESLISDECELVERIRYDAYGRARHIWRGDLDQDGTFWFIDRNIGPEHIVGSSIGDNGTWPAENYNVLMDFDYSGTIESDEFDAIQNDPDEAALAAGRMSDADFASGPWNPIGYDGYVYDDAADMSCVRFRWYDAKLGRWVSRDPAGYMDGASLLLYVAGDPMGFVDPSGLKLRIAKDPLDTPGERHKQEIIEDILRNLCPAIEIDPVTGVVSFQPTCSKQDIGTLACRCLQLLIDNAFDNRIFVLDDDILQQDPEAKPADRTKAYWRTFWGWPYASEGSAGDVWWDPEWTGNEFDDRGRHLGFSPDEAILGHELCGHVLMYNSGFHPDGVDREWLALEIESIIRRELGLHPRQKVEEKPVRRRR